MKKWRTVSGGHRIVFCFLLVGCGLWNEAHGSQLPSAKSSRSVKAGGWSVTWEPGVAVARPPDGGPELTVYRDAKFNEAGDPDPAGTCGFETNELISIVGPVISYQYHYEGSCGAHPSYGSSLKAVTLDRGVRPAVVTDLFDEHETLIALLQAKTIADALKGQTPHDLASLIKMLGSPCDMDFRDLLSSFAVLDVGRRLAVVRFGIGHGCEAARGTTTEFDVVIPVTENREWFEQASANHTLWLAETRVPPRSWYDEP